ncbi:hypothetical protein NBRC3257_0502 [Gluconobacter thailandicus NBRC 3257]|uniref:Uncharacterized protein n=1 Tax=Gluconobacter thailandicus NBRC 3257 TaxID=1381097 RepID=A0ABQ0IVH3_GLUTH|nr:hypothetical protein NBRC3255_1198 [Gluconobacter thailandicus NBRC 3255]GAD25503.1 hypothetical protein NBRC3257_0502 [Gluconobacter thailandicus NBRC 3257]
MFRFAAGSRPFAINWLMVGMRPSQSLSYSGQEAPGFLP